AGFVGLVLQFAADLHLIEVVGARDDDLVDTVEDRVAQDLFLDLGGEYVHPPDDQHVVAAAGDAAHAPEAAGSRGQQPGEVAGAVAHDRQGFLGERSEDQFAFLAVGHRLTGGGVDDFRIEMVFPDHRAVLGFDALRSDARAHDFGQPVDVHGIQPQLAFDLGAHAVAPGFGAEDPDLQGNVVGGDSLPVEFFRDDQGIGRRHHDDVGPQVHDQLHLFLGLPAGHGDDRTAGALRAIVGAQAAGEQAVAVGDVDGVARAAARCADRSRHQLGPGVDVLQGVADDGGLAGRARRSMQAGQAFPGHGEHAEGVVAAQVFLGGAGEFADVFQALQVVGVDAARVEGLAVVRYVFVGVAQGLAQALELQCGDLVSAGCLDGLQIPGLDGFDGHDVLSPVSCDSIRGRAGQDLCTLDR